MILARVKPTKVSLSDFVGLNMWYFFESIPIGLAICKDASRNKISTSTGV